MEDCLASIKDQGITDFETVLVLDHITEDISDIIEKYSDINIKKVELNKEKIKDRKFGSEENAKVLKDHSGAAAAKNAGIEAAEGEYIYFLDSDDYILNGTIPYLLREAEEQQADFVYGRRNTTWNKRMVYLAYVEDHNDDTGAINNDEDKTEPENYKKEKVEQEISLAYPGIDRERLRQMTEAYYNLILSRKGFMNVTLTGVLIRRSFLESNGLRFNEKFIFFYDLGFMIRMLNMAKSFSMAEEAVYVKRYHNDPIHYPALSQIKTADRFEEYMESYSQARKLAQNNPVLCRILDYKFLNAFVKTFARNIARDKDELWRTERFKLLNEAMQEVEPSVIGCFKGYEKKIVKDILSGKLNKLKFRINFNLGIKKLLKIRKRWRVLACYLYEHYFIKLPVKDNWVICESFFGKSYSDSPKYIYEYLCKNYPGKFKFIWVINKRTKIPYKPIKVRRFSIRYAYYLARCKYYVFNVRQPDWVVKRKGNVFLQTWHGTPLKRLVFDQEEVMTASPLYKAQFYKHSRLWDYLVSANKFSSEVFRSAFLYDKEILEYGYPRNDLMYHPDKDKIAADIKRKLRIPEGKKTILYAPTWRDDEYYGKGEYKFSLKLNLRLLRKELGNDYAILLRTHYYIADKLDVTGLEDFVVNVSGYDDITELYLISDILITDYSSVFFDYANLKRPILFYTYDLEKYRDMLRGFYLDIEKDVPGPLLFTDEEVVEAIKNIDIISARYKEKYEEFYEKFCSLDNGQAAKMVARRVFNLE
ncbi:CDP-glycerol glycerophosphotransferase [Herbinix hemicellulosilytica]|uniref:Glycosyltransferase 2-like domain-containing protein n=1 Tax=Herbinix hemicellulosilytica TaxID=1564487 RepID=A0A0H5ST27_HERHM|nr:CDP-glycerol glycerophosphotransferase [Herbinix hemicellulosilytica]CRZ33453.1 hypothetical protein HHT355_0241 [Herbinix hemicellulosilytica]